MGSEKKKCMDCEWWNQGGVAPPGLLVGTCRGGPPTAGTERYAKYPLTLLDEYCAAYTPKVDESADKMGLDKSQKLITPSLSIASISVCLVLQ